MAVILLIIAWHFRPHHLHQFLFAHHPRSACAHDSEQRRVPRPDGINRHPLKPSRLHEQIKGYQILLTGLSQLTSAMIASRIPEMRIISMIAITRLGRLNSSASRSSIIATIARKSIVFNFVITIAINCKL